MNKSAGVSGMKSGLLLAFLLFAFSVPGLSRAQDMDGDAHEEVRVTVDARGKTEAEVREEGISKARKKAVKACLSGRVPGPVLEEHESDVAALQADAERFTLSWELLDQGRMGGQVVMRVMVYLDGEAIDSALKKRRMMPARPLPRVFLIIPSAVGEEDLPSIWERSPGVEPVLNQCEAQVAGALWDYGFSVLEPWEGMEEFDPAKIIAPRDEKEREEVFELLEERFAAGALVVGRGEAGPALELPREEDEEEEEGVEQEEGAGEEGCREGEEGEECLEEEVPERARILVRMAAADVGGQKIVWADRYDYTVDVKGILARQKALESTCREAGEDVTVALYRAWLPRPGQGEGGDEEKELVILLSGVDGYADMAAFQQKMIEAPGAIAIKLARISRRELEFRMKTTGPVNDTAQWMAESEFGDKKIEVVQAEDNIIKAEMK